MSDSMAAQLDKVRRGQSTQVHSYGQALLPADIRALADALKSNQKIERLVLSKADLTAWIIEPLATALAENTTLTEIELSGNELSAKAVADLARHLEHHPNLRKLDLSCNPLGDDGAKEAAKLAARNPALFTLKLRECEIGDAGAEALADMVTANRNLAVLLLSDNQISDRGMDAFQDMLRTNQTLATLHLDGNPCSASYRMTLGQAAMEAVSPNITALTGTTYQPLRELCVHNSSEAITLMNRIKLSKTPTDVSVATFYATENRLSATAKVKAPHIYKAYERLTGEMPQAAPETINAPDDLFAKNAESLCPMDNPLVWRQFPAICAKLRESGAPLTRQHLDQQNRDGQSWLQTALANAPLAQVMAGLRESGIRLQGKELLENGKASPLLSAMLENGSVRQLFNEENWRGASSMELRSVIRAIPEAKRPANVHGLLASLGRNQNDRAR